MSNSPRARLHTEAEDFNSPRPDATASGAVSAVRAAAFACPEEHASLHHLLRRQLRDAHLPGNADTPELRALLPAVGVDGMALLDAAASAELRSARYRSIQEARVFFAPPGLV